MQEIVNEIQSKFDSEIERKFEKRQLPDSPLRQISNSYNLSHHSSDLIGVIPEVLCGYLAGGKLREEVILKNAESSLSLKDRKGILLCHALSPFNESLGFYCDLGRAFRLSLGLNLPIHIMLAGKQWSEYNWVVKDLNLKSNLKKNEEWRTEVYRGILNTEPDVLSIDDVNKNYGVDVHSEANEYLLLLTKMFGSEITLNKYSDSEVEEILNRDNFLFSIEDLNIIKKGIQPIRTTIECVLRNFNRADEETFIYFLTQYYHQSKYNGCIKISMRREKDFDDSFRMIHGVSPNSKIKHDNLIGLYLEDYKYGLIDGRSLTVHPYYFPSGVLYSLFKDDLQKSVDNCIMITDFDNKVKIKAIINKLNYFQRARLLSDLLSFGHALSQKHEFVRHKISKWFKSNKPEYFFYSWERFTNKNNKGEIPLFINDWTNLIFSKWANHENFPIPYWYLPFFWDKKEEPNENHVSIDDQVDLISIILNEANSIYKSPILTTNPLIKSKK